MPNRSVPWLGVGTSGTWSDPKEAAYEAGVDFDVYREVAQTEDGRIVPGIFVNSVFGSNRIVGVTSDKYGIIQNNYAFELLDPFMAQGAVITQAGMTDSGMVFMVAEFTQTTILGDDFTLYACVMNSFNAKYPFALIITPIRVICQNMFRKLMKGGDSIFSFKHGNLIDNRIAAAKDTIRNAYDYKQRLTTFLEEAATLKLTGSIKDSALRLMFPTVDPSLPQAKATNARREEQREEFLQSYYLAPDNANFIDTAYGFINAYFDWLSHRQPVRAGANSNNWEERRMVGLLGGGDVNRKIIERVMR